MKNEQKVVIVGGCGHVGLPLGLAMASRGLPVGLLDINQQAVAEINAGRLPFLEQGGEAILRQHLGRNLRATAEPGVIRDAAVVIFVTGTPIDEHLNPRLDDVIKVVRQYAPWLHPRQLVVLRSTLYPGTTEVVAALLQETCQVTKLAFCPERIQQGRGIEEIFTLPQLVSAMTPEAEAEAKALFSILAPKIIVLPPEEAELAKLMTNCWRYLEFAIANQFYMMATEKGHDFFRIYQAMTEDYPRAHGFAAPGLTAGPCLFKDIMQLAAFHRHNFHLGHSAMLINEGLPIFLVDCLERKLGGAGALAGRKVAILGMTFKADNDDTRDSLSFKIKKILQFRRAELLVSDPYLPDTLPVVDALAQAEAIILGAPHAEYHQLRPTQPYVDCWGIWR
ncbi:MAG: nucleotide sugar dehydrogenase [Lentisphaeria bacterium]|nr:nucleotide sugar dehydrogenase [Lentisphaeria bacterium]